MKKKLRLTGTLVHPGFKKAQARANKLSFFFKEAYNLSFALSFFFFVKKP